jgi:hypothetical protein
MAEAASLCDFDFEATWPETAAKSVAAEAIRAVTSITR